MNIKPRTLRAKLCERACVGTFVSIRDPFVVGLLAEAGFEFILLDLEHFPMSPELVQAMVTTAQARGVGVVLRVADSRRATILHALETGADGILVPMVSSVAEAERVVSYARYAPFGERGFHPLTASAEYGSVPPNKLAEYSNQRCLVGVQIETKAGLQSCEDIASVSGVDLVFAGPGDLAQSLGVAPGSTGLEEALERIYAAGNSARNLRGTFAATGEQLQRARRVGVRFLVHGSDSMILAKGARDLVQAARPSELRVARAS